MFASARKLREAGVLGLNERNAEFIMRLNPRRLYPRVDDKALTKQLALEAGMPVPDLYGIIDNQGDIRRFQEIVADFEERLRKALEELQSADRSIQPHQRCVPPTRPTARARPKRGDAGSDRRRAARRIVRKLKRSDVNRRRRNSWRNSPSVK